MSVLQDNFVLLYYKDDAAKAKIFQFFKEYFELFDKTFGEDHRFLSGFPTDRCAVKISENGEEKYVECNIILSDQELFWDYTPVSFFSPFLDSSLCTKIVWKQFQDNGFDTYYVNEKVGGGANFSWKKCVFDWDKMVDVYQSPLHDFIEEEEDEDEKEKMKADEAYAMEKLREAYPGGLMDDYVKGVLDGTIDVEWEEAF